MSQVLSRIALPDLPTGVHVVSLAVAIGKSGRVIEARTFEPGADDETARALWALVDASGDVPAADAIQIAPCLYEATENIEALRAQSGDYVLENNGVLCVMHEEPLTVLTDDAKAALRPVKRAAKI